MSIEENVDGMNEQTEAIAQANEESQEAASKAVSTVLGKFKDVDALARAYESLQAEFTRRSQRLRTLEKEAENFKSREGASGAEKLRKAAKSRREAAKQFDAFVAEVSCPATKEKPDSLEEGLGEIAPDERKEAGEVSTAVKATQEQEKVAQGEAPEGEGARSVDYEGKGSSAEKSENAPASCEELYRQATLNEEVRLRIVGEYLASLGKSGVPLTSGSAGVTVTPPARAKTVGQAGDMALLYFRRPTVD